MIYVLAGSFKESHRWRLDKGHDASQVAYIPTADRVRGRSYLWKSSGKEHKMPNKCPHGLTSPAWCDRCVVVQGSADSVVIVGTFLNRSDCMDIMDAVLDTGANAVEDFTLDDNAVPRASVGTTGFGVTIDASTWATATPQQVLDDLKKWKEAIKNQRSTTVPLTDLSRTYVDEYGDRRTVETSFPTVQSNNTNPVGYHRERWE